MNFVGLYFFSFRIAIRTASFLDGDEPGGVVDEGIVWQFLPVNQILHIRPPGIKNSRITATSEKYLYERQSLVAPFPVFSVAVVYLISMPP
jgi:hypothetical protein